jgi:hypothetical protein
VKSVNTSPVNAKVPDTIFETAGTLPGINAAPAPAAFFWQRQKEKQHPHASRRPWRLAVCKWGQKNFEFTVNK